MGLPSSSVVRALYLHDWGPGLIPGWGIAILQAVSFNKKKKKKKEKKRKKYSHIDQ